VVKDVASSGRASAAEVAERTVIGEDRIRQREQGFLLVRREPEVGGRIEVMESNQ
jgi:hypothetical protein